VVAGVVVLAVVVVGLVIWNKSVNNATAGQNIPVVGTTLAPGVVEKRDGVVVTTGKPGASTTIDIYADFLCPICGEFQKTDSPQIEQQINAGTLQVRYHMVPLLNERSNPAGYSLDSANAALAAADAGKFTEFHDSLFAKQPEEGKRGYDKAQLIQLGKDMGITDPQFAATINAGTYNEQINAEYQKTLQDTNLRQDGGFGTPTVAVGGKAISRQEGWLTQLLASKQSS